PPFQFYPPRSPIQSQTESPDFPREGFEPDKRVRPLARASGNERAARSPQGRNGQKPFRLIPTGAVRWHCRRPVSSRFFEVSGSSYRPLLRKSHTKHHHLQLPPPQR